mgnify:CR=1 FL=1
MTVQENGVNLRAESQTGSRIIAQLQAGEVLERTGKNEEWSRVLYDGRTCYVASQYVKVQEPEKIVQEPVPEADAPQGRAVPADAAVMAASDGTVIPSLQWADCCAGRRPSGERKIPQRSRQGRILSPRGRKCRPELWEILWDSGECDVTLSIARKAKQILTERGYTVIMTRESNDINLKLRGEGGDSQPKRCRSPCPHPYSQPGEYIRIRYPCHLSVIGKSLQQRHIRQKLRSFQKHLGQRQPGYRSQKPRCTADRYTQRNKLEPGSGYGSGGWISEQPAGGAAFISGGVSGQNRSGNCRRP